MSDVIWTLVVRWLETLTPERIGTTLFVALLFISMTYFVVVAPGR